MRTADSRSACMNETLPDMRLELALTCSGRLGLKDPGKRLLMRLGYTPGTMESGDGPSLETVPLLQHYPGWYVAGNRAEIAGTP